MSSGPNHFECRTRLCDLIDLSRFDVRLILMAIVLLCCNWNSSSASDDPTPTTADRSHELHAPKNLLGVNSCAAASCHGGGRLSEGRSFAAYQIWARKDPHATAFATLSNAESRQMMVLLNKGKGGPVDATNDVRCLSCHSTTEFEEDPLQVSEDHQLSDGVSCVSDGVSCESCHGPSKRWLGLHSTREWKTLSAEQKSEHGFLDTTTDLAARVKMCADCHIGSPGRDVNHDLIAAGHPRLNFEFSAYYANLPKHWSTATATPVAGDSSEPADVEEDPAFEARAWLVGQLVSSKTSLQLLQHRTKQGNPWPELAEYSCFSCHHDLKNDSWYQTRGNSKGQFAWGTWNYGTLPELLQDQNTVQQFDRFRLLMQKPFPEPQKAAEEAKALELSLDSLIALQSKRSFSREELDQLTRHVVSERLRKEQDTKTVNWDQTAQLYLATTALALASSKVGGDDAKSKLILEDLKLIRELLMFQASEESPTKYSESKTIDDIQQRLTNIKATLSDVGTSLP